MKKTVGLLFAALSASVLAAIAGGAVAGKNDRGGLSKHDRELVAKAEANGAARVPLLVGTVRGSDAAVADALASLGGTIRYRDDQLGYMRVDVPTAKADAAAKVAGVLTANVDVAVPAEDPDAGPAAPEALPVPTPGPLNAFMPTGDIGAQQFVAANPRFDGRGIKVGIVDTGVDVDRPELKTALDRDGNAVPKIFDWVTTTAPNLADAANGDATWVPMTAVTVAGGTFTSGGKTFTAPALPANAEPAFGLFFEGDERLGGQLGSDVNRDGDSDDSFGVLEDRSSDTVWVDTNQNGSFADEKAMQNYRKNLDVGHFGVDDPATGFVVESVPFTVQTDDADGFVNIGITSAGHGTHVAGTVAGKGFLNGSFNGVAPNAQLAVARVCLFITGCFTSAQIEAFLHLIKKDHVDVIQMSIGGLAALNDGQSTQELIVDRLTKVFGVQFVFSQGNSGPGANTAGAPGTANLAIGTGAYQSQATWTANYGNTPPKADTLWAFSSRGPREDGGLKPQVVAPGSELSTWPAWNLESGSVRPYDLPPGYDMIQGTSMASPMVAGSVALLLSAAQQSKDGKVTPAQIRKALFSTARFIPGYQTYEQGNGLIQVGAAWNLLKQGLSTPSIGSTAPVETAISEFLDAPDTGVGIYEREGWKTGDVGTRTITFTRDPKKDSHGDDDAGDNADRGHDDGRGRAVTYNVVLKGNDGTFSAPSTLSIGPNSSAGLPVRIAPSSAGIHSTIVALDDPSSPGLEYETEATVVAALEPTEAGNFTVAGGDASVDRADKRSFFVSVAPNTPALNITETITAGRTRVDLTDPWGLPVVLNAAAPCGCAEDFTTGPATKTVTIQNPKAGVWEIDLEASRSAPIERSTSSVAAALLGADVSPTSWTIDPAQVGHAVTNTFTFTNRLAAFSGGSAGTAFGSAFKATRTANAGGPQQVTDIAVPAGATQLTVTIGNASDPSADLDLFLFDCTSGTCVLAKQSAGGTANETVTVANPAAGSWKAVVDLFAIPSGTTTYAYTDVYQQPTLGGITTVDPARAHPRNDVWSAVATATPGGVPAAGRLLQGFVQVKADTAVIGQAEVDALNVTP